MTATQSTTQTPATTAISGTEIMYFGVGIDSFDAIVDIVQYSEDEFLIFFVNYTHEDLVRCEYVDVKYPLLENWVGYVFDADSNQWEKSKYRKFIDFSGRRKNSKAYKDFHQTIQNKLQALMDNANKVA